MKSPARAPLLLALSLSLLPAAACAGKSSPSSGDGTNTGGSGSSSGSGGGGSSGGSSGSSSGGGSGSSSGSSSGVTTGNGSTSGSSSGSAGSGVPEPAAIVGTWTYSGEVPDIVHVTLTLRADGTFTFAEQVAPLTTPVHGGGVIVGDVTDASGPCITTDTYEGTYVATTAGALAWTFVSGITNAVSNCLGAVGDTPGTPMTLADVAAYQAEALFPPANETYTQTATTLVLDARAGDSGGAGGFDGVVTMVKAP